MSLQEPQDSYEECDFCTDHIQTTGHCLDHLWPDGDITPAEIEPYKTVLQKAIRAQECILTSELHLVAMYNFVARLETVLEVVKTLKTALHCMTDNHGCTDYKRPVTPALHTALKKDNTEAAVLLILYGGPSLVMTSILDTQYEGTTGLHLAVVNGNRDVIKAMLDILGPSARKELIHSQAVGTFFCEDKFLSSLPLSLGVCCTGKDILCDLVGYGANLDSRESSFGDAVLHTIVRTGSQNSDNAIDMMMTILDSEESKLWWCERREISIEHFSQKEKSKFRRYLFKMKNFEGYTPLTLSAKLGLPHLVTTILDLEGVYRFTDWKFGKKSTARFEMDEIDGILTQKAENAVVDLLMDNDDNALHAFNCPALKRLSEVKWDYIWVLFTFWFFYHLTVMVVFTTIAVISPLKYFNGTPLANETFTVYYRTTEDYFRLGGEILVIFTAALYGTTEILFMARSLIYMIYTWSLKISSKKKGDGWIVARQPDAFRIVLRTFCVCVIVWMVLRVRESLREDIPMALGLITGWYFLLFFTRAVEVSAFFTVMIHRMLVGDLLRFMFTFSALLVGFGTATMVLYKGAPNGLPHQLRSFDITLLTMFRLLTGLSDLDTMGEARSPLAASALYICFVCVATILLLNMLIAAMSDTYASVSEKKELFFLKYRLLSILYVENNVPCVYRTKRMVSRYMNFDKHSQRWELTVNNA